MNKSVSDKQIKELFNNKCNVISYDEIYKHQSLNSLLHPYGHAIILYVWDDMPSYSGHWVALCYHKNNKLLFFDSLGNSDIELLKEVPRRVSVRTHQSYPYLSNLILKSKCEPEYNMTQLQQDGSATCGRYSCHMIRNIHKFKTLNDYINHYFPNASNKLENDKRILQETSNYFI
jgi:hypothetical protein